LLDRLVKNLHVQAKHDFVPFPLFYEGVLLALQVEGILSLFISFDNVHNASPKDMARMGRDLYEEMAHTFQGSPIPSSVVQASLLRIKIWESSLQQQNEYKYLHLDTFLITNLVPSLEEACASKV
jgi:hypothetical protein